MSSISASQNQRARPTARDAGPFLLVAVLGLGSVLLPPYTPGGVEVVIMLSTFGVVCGIHAVSLQRDRRTWVDPASSYLFFVSLYFARDLTGGTGSGLAAMVALPIVWLSITGIRRDLWVASALTVLLFVVPIVIVGPPMYEVADWRRAVGWTAFALIVAPVIQRIVRQLARETQRARLAGAEMDGIMRGATLTSIVSTDLDGTIRSFSAGAEDLLGYASEDVVGLADQCLFHDPDEVAAVAVELGVEPGLPVFAALALAASPSRTWTYVRADGSRFFVRLVLTELRDGVGRTTGYLSVAIDATAAVESRRALANSEARWRVLLDHLPDTTVVMVDDSYEIKVVAGAGAVQQGLRGTEGKRLSEVSNPENVRLLSALVDQALQGREASDQMNATATGMEHEVVATPLPNDGEERRVLILARNVSTERARERALLRAKHRAERLFADAPHGLALLDQHGIVLSANAAMAALTGIARSELVGRSLVTLSCPGDTELDHHLERVLASPLTSVQTEWTLRDASGSDIHVVLSSRTLAEEGADDLVLVNVVDVSERRLYEQRLAHLADHDVLTGLANRRLFERALEAHLEQCRLLGPGGALLLLDLDHFKGVNDTLGHGAGDQLLVSVAELITRTVRHDDLVARLGGDEFAILLTQGGRTAAQAVAESIVTAIRDHTATLEGTVRRVTGSVGAVTLQAASGHAVDVLALADMTMYDAKDAGRDQYVILDEDSIRQPQTATRLEWQTRIERALEEDGFVLHLQPIRDLRTHEVHAAEVLIRMRDGDDVVPPAMFLPVAERAGLMPAVDSWVLRHSVAMLAELRRLDPAFRLEVNLSGLSICHPDTERAITESLLHHAVDPAALILEITETAVVVDVAVRPGVRRTDVLAGLSVRPRRLRCGLRVVLLPEAPAVRLREDRRRVRVLLPHLGHRPHHPAVDRRDRSRPGQADRRRVRQRPGHPRGGARRRRRPRAGLPDRQTRALRRVRHPLPRGPPQRRRAHH